MHSMPHFFSTFLMLSVFPYAAQSQLQQKGSYTVYVNTPGESIRASVAFENKPHTAKEELSYFWYASNKILETKGGFSGRLLDGSYTSYYLSDNLKEQGTYKNGLRDDQWKTWYESGKLREIIHWNNGLREGRYKKFDQRGNLITESNYRKGKLNGYEIFYEKEKIISKKEYKKGIEILPKNKKAAEKDSPPKQNKFRLFKKPLIKTEAPLEKTEPEKKKKKEKMKGPDGEPPLASANHKKKISLKSRWNKLFKKEKDQPALTKNEKTSDK